MVVPNEAVKEALMRREKADRAKCTRASMQSVMIWVNSLVIAWRTRDEFTKSSASRSHRPMCGSM
jgi:hypothetical protein